MHQRYFKVSLASAPEIRTNGSFGDSTDHVSWVQPGDLWQALMLHHGGSFLLNGYAFPLQPFDLIIVPPGGRCEIQRSGEDIYVYDYFTFVPVQSDRDLVALPLQTHFSDEGRFWALNFRRALGRLQLSRTSAAAVAYSMLWAVAEPVHHLSRNVYVEATERLIDDRLDQLLRVSDIAEEIGVSQSQLCRLFVTEHGKTPKQYLGERRAQLAHRLLTQTTTPIKQVAASCGIGNVHTFNRFVREWLGASPRSVRAGRGSVDVYRVAMYKAALTQASTSPE